MKLERKLLEWRDAGLIDADTAARIAAHEAAGEQRPYLLYAVSGLGALSVAIGLVSIVASNWEAIPGGVKLGLDFVLLAGLAAAIYRARSSRLATEILLFVFYGAVLASIGLVAQVYHLGGRTEDALLFWSLITAPIVLHGTTRFLAATWFIGAESVALAQLFRFLERHWHRSDTVVALTAAYLLSLGLVALGLFGWFQRRKPAFASVAAILGRVQIVALATMVPLAWYDRADNVENGMGLGVVCLAGIIGASVALALRDEAGRAARGSLVTFAVVAPLITYLPLLGQHDRFGGMAAASFLIVWAIIGVVAYRLGRIRLLNVATAFLGVRLLIIYFEVFGSLLDTGIGLLSGGILTIALAWLWVKKSRQWSKAERHHG
ncbi:Membrane protein [Minicystis rosea]|nr:Membrane protein [Minicystis rosea]